jgi:hypothetical protein
VTKKKTAAAPKIKAKPAVEEGGDDILMDVDEAARADAGGDDEFM